MALARELLRSIEHFVLSTPDLDVPAFLHRIRSTAAQITPEADPADLEEHRRWVADSLSAFGQLQRRYLSEREDELWRLLSVYQDHQKTCGQSDKQFQQNLKGVHERMGNLVRLDDLRQVRARLEQEIDRAGTLVEQKGKADEERAAALVAKVHQLEAALVSARHEALRDALTGVYNRGSFVNQMETSLQSPTPCVFAMIDVDNFKSINDTLGHLVGDQVLCQAVQILSRAARPGDLMGRYGGDEFCLLVPVLAPERLAERFHNLAGPRDISFHFDSRHCMVRLSFSIGIASSRAGDTVETLIQRADEALYEAKRAGKGRVVVAPKEG